MESRRVIICHACHEVQRDRWAYCNRLLRVHGEVIRGGTDTPLRLEGRELEVVWSICASRRREALGLPRVQIKRRHAVYTRTGLVEPGVAGQPPVLMMPPDSGPPDSGRPVQ